MKTRFKRLAMTAILLSGTGAALADESEISVVGDISTIGEEAYFHEDGAYVDDVVDDPGSEQSSLQQSGSFVADRDYDAAVEPALGTYVGSPTVTPSPYAPIGAGELQPASFLGKLGGSGCDSCDGACDGGCDSAGSSKKRRMRVCDIFDRLDSDTWATAEFLMWFVQDRDMPALISTANPGADVTLPPPQGPNPDNVQVVFGDDIDGELSGGFRTDYGKWINSNVGIGGRFWILAENEDSYNATGNGTGISIGRPFFNAALPGEDSIRINNDGTGASPQFGGSVTARSSLDIWGGEAYSRIKLNCDRNCRVEFIGGYSHFEIDDELSISSTSVEAGPGRITIFNDRFDAENRFDGGQLGFEMIIRRGKWSARSLTKVHLGNMEQRYRISGSTSDQTPPAAANNFPVGMLARGNSGTFERDKFAFVPEANFKLAYQLRKNMMFSVGYSFIYWDNVALNGDVIDRVITDGADLQAGIVGARPQFAFDDSSLWVQGLDLGFTVNY